MRRLLRLGVAAGAAVAVVATAAFLAGLLLVQREGGVGADRARDGMFALRAGDAATAVAAFDEAAAAFQRADAVADAWWMAPAGALPVVDDHLEATRVVTDAGRSLAEASAEAAPAAAVDQLAGPDGRIRIERLRTLAPLSARVVAALEHSDAELTRVGSTWLAGPLRAAVAELHAEVTDALPGARRAADLLRVAPELLGGEGPRSYAVLFANPAEARAMGGFVANIGLLTADDGRLAFEALDDPSALEARLAASRTSPDADLPAAFTSSARPHRFVRNWTDALDIDDTAAAVRAFLPAAAGRSVDGAVYADPYVVAALLHLTGPVTIEGSGETLGPANAVDFLLRDQYLAAGFEPGEVRKERLGAAGADAFHRLVGSVAPDLPRLGELLGPLVEARRLQFSTADPDIDAVLAGLGLRPAPVAPDDVTLFVAHGNRRANKLDAYLDRRIEHSATVATDGTVRATARITLINRAPTTGLDDYQRSPAVPGDPTPRETAVVRLDVVTSLDATAVRVMGRPAVVNIDTSTGRQHLQVPVEVPATGRVTVEIDLTGRVDPGACRFVFLPNAGAGVDHLDASLQTSSGTVTAAGPLDRLTEMSCR